MKILKGLLLVLVVIYCLVLLAAYTLQDKLLFFPDRLDKNYRYNLSDSDKEVFIRTSDNIMINGILYRRPGNGNVILYFHGNGGSLNSWQDISTEILDLNADLLLIDYRGYGKSEGSFSEKGFYTDADAAYKYLLQNGYQPNQIIVYGRSIGTGIAVQLALTQKIKALILESPYTSLPNLAAEKMPYLLPGLLLKYKLNTLKRAPELKEPVLVIHGTVDELIPLKHGQQVFDAIISTKRLLLIEGGGHNNLSQFPEHDEGIKSFIKSL
jgi:uncharacterized protein